LWNVAAFTVDGKSQSSQRTLTSAVADMNFAGETTHVLESWIVSDSHQERPSDPATSMFRRDHALKIDSSFFACACKTPRATILNLTHPDHADRNPTLESEQKMMPGFGRNRL
jgi:hypothetical protein